MTPKLRTAMYVNPERLAMFESSFHPTQKSLSKYHVIDGQSTCDQVTIGSRSNDQISFCAFHSFLVVALMKHNMSHACIITTWRLGLWASLVACYYLFYFFSFLRWMVQNSSCSYTELWHWMCRKKGCVPWTREGPCNPDSKHGYKSGRQGSIHQECLHP